MMEFINLPEDVVLNIKDSYLENDKDSIEHIISFLKELGYFQMETVFSLVKYCGLDLIKANLFVSNSKAWG